MGTLPDGDPQMCVVNNFGGFSHPYAYCVKPSSKMVNSGDLKSNLGMKNTGKVLKGIFNYVNYLTINANSATASECLYEGKGVIGNKYVLKSNSKCKVVNSNGDILGEQNLHKYINNQNDGGGFMTGGQPLPDVNGMIPSTFSSAAKIGGNIFDLLTSFSGNTKPYCMKANMKCHVIDNVKYKKYDGNSPDVYLSIDDINKLNNTDFSGNTKPNIPTTISGENFSNLINNIDTINKNIIDQNIDKIQNFSEFDKMLNTINFNDELLVKTYYIGFSLLLLIIMFKLLYKK